MKPFQSILFVSIFLLAFAGAAEAAVNIKSGSVYVDNNQPCPGDVIALTVTLLNTDNPISNAEGRMRVTLEDTTTHTTCGNYIATSEADKWWVITTGSSPSPAPPIVPVNPDPNDGGKVTNVGGTPWGTRTITYNIKIPASVVVGRIYQLNIGVKDYYEGVSDAQDRTCLPITINCAPSPSAAFVQKRVEGVAGSGNIMVYWIDYDFTNSTNNVVTDVIPACMTILGQSPQPFSGAAASVVGNTVTWRTEDATPASVPLPYKAKGSLFVYVSLGGACAYPVCNQASYVTSALSGTTNQICQASGTNVILTKSQYDQVYAPIPAGGNVVNGSIVNYVLKYDVSGTQLHCFDSFNSYAPGTYATSGTGAIGYGAGAWYGAPPYLGSQWNIVSTNGDNSVYYNNNASTYGTLLYSCPSATFNGEDFCGGMVVADVMHNQPADVNADVGIWLRNDGKNPAKGYMIIVSGDTNPGGGHLIVQRNNGTSGSGCCNWYGYAPTTQAYDGVWYTVKALEVPGSPGQILAKFWERGTPEPSAWMLNWTDPLGALPCGTSGDGTIWAPGLAGQNATSRYDNFHVFSAVSLTNAQIWDTVPAGIDYQSASPAPNGSTPVCCGLNEGMVRWDFTGNNYGALAGLLYAGSGSFTWTGIADCSEGLTATNIARMGASAPAVPQNSNTTNLNITGCGSPSFTPTRSSTATSTATPTATATATDTVTASPTATSTATPTATPTRTNTPSPTSTYTATPSSTATSTYTVTPSPSSTYTATNTITLSPSPTDTLTLGPSPTPTFTSTASPTSTATPTFTATATQSNTSTDTPTQTITASNTSTYTATPTVTLTTQYSATNTPTSTDTASVTPTDTETITFTNTSTQTATPTATATFSASYTPTVTATVTATATPSASFTASPTTTVTPTGTVSWTASATPIPVPHRVIIGAYNSAGELVKLIFNGGAQYLPGDLKLSADVVPGGAGSLTISFPGYLIDPNGSGPTNSVLWLADNNGGQFVAGGVYYIKAEIIDTFGQTTTLQRSVQVVSVAPQNYLRIFNSAGEVVASIPLPVNSGTGRFASMKLSDDKFGPKYDEASGAIVGGSLQVLAMDEHGHEYPSYWDGKNSQGVPVASGNYTAELVYNAPGGGGTHVIQAKSFIVLQSSNAATLAGSYAYPNPILHGEEIKINYPLSATYSTAARLFNVAGELISQCEDPYHTGTMRFLSKHLAAGIYVVKIEKLSGAAIVARTTIKVAVVH